MSIIDINSSFVQLLKRDGPLHLTLIGNIVHLHLTPKQPSLDDATEEDENLELHKLEAHFKKMKGDYKLRQDSLIKKMNQNQSLTTEEEEWLNGQGNLIEEQMLIEKIKSLKNKSNLTLNSDDARSLKHICEYVSESGKKEKENPKKLKKTSDIKIENDKKRKASKSDVLASNGKNNSDIFACNKKKKSLDTPTSTSNKKKQKSSSNSRATDSKIKIATYAQKVEVLDWYHKNGKNQTNTAKHFSAVYPELNIKQPLLSKWLKSEDTIWSKENQSAHSSTRKIRQLSYPKVESALAEWMTQAIHCNMTITGNVLKVKWRDFARLAGVPTEDWLKLSGGWLDSFKKRHQLKSYRKHGEAASVDPIAVESEVERVQKITEDYELKNIFNMDETGLFYL
jgi:hypothetical protein